MDVRSLILRRELLDTAPTELTARPGVLFHGPAGIGRSTLVAALAASLAEHERSAGTVLHCSPAQEDTGLPFVGLVDLFARVPESCLEVWLPNPGRELRAALLRGQEPAGGRSRLAVRVAVLEVLRSLAATGPVLLVVDDLQWLDEPSAEVLAFAVRRVEGLGVRVVAAELVRTASSPHGCAAARRAPSNFPCRR